MSKIGEINRISKDVGELLFELDKDRFVSYAIVIYFDRSTYSDDFNNITRLTNRIQEFYNIFISKDDSEKISTYNNSFTIEINYTKEYESLVQTLVEHLNCETIQNKLTSYFTLICSYYVEDNIIKFTTIFVDKSYCIDNYNTFLEINNTSKVNQLTDRYKTKLSLFE